MLKQVSESKSINQGTVIRDFPENVGVILSYDLAASPPTTLLHISSS